jgi:hypothetical protein
MLRVITSVTNSTMGIRAPRAIPALSCSLSEFFSGSSRDALKPESRSGDERPALRHVARTWAAAEQRNTSQTKELQNMTTSTQVNEVTKQKTGGPNLTSLIPYEQICQAGAYVCCWNGHLLRVTNEAITSCGCPAVNIVGPEPLFVIKISDDPFVSMTKARWTACNLDVAVNF